MRRIQRERGEGKTGCLFWVLLLLVGGLVAAKLVPVEMKKMKLRDHMQELASTQGHRPQAFYEKEIGNKARELGLTIPKDQIQVKKYENRIIMDVEFTVPIDLTVYQWDWTRKIHLAEDIFWF